MPTVFLAPAPILNTQFIPGGNVPASGGQLFAYISGSSTKLNTFTTSSGAVANANPYVLDSGGNLTGSREIWLIQSSTYRFVLAPSNDTDPPSSPYWTMDSISGINSNPTQVPIEWVTGPTAVFQNTSTFSIGGDVTAIFDAGRRVRTFNTGGTIYGVVSTSVFSASTTITILTDSGILDSGLTSADYAVFDAAHVSFPFGRALQGINSPGLRIEFQTQFAQLLSALNGLTVQTGTLSASTAAFTGLLGFYGSGATTQAANISSVTSTGSVSTVGVFGFTTSTQPNNLVSTVNALSATLKRYGLTS